MRPAAFVNTFTTLVIFYAGAGLSIPTPWSESLLEDINNLRASGLSEAEIGLRFPRALFYPDPASAKITLYSPPDLRSYTHHSPAASTSTTNRNSNHANFMTRLAQKLGLNFFSFFSTSTCTDDNNDVDITNHNVPHNAAANSATASGTTNIKDAAYDEELLWELINDEEDRRHGGGTSFKEGVGRRGGEMGRKEEKEEVVQEEM